MSTALIRARGLTVHFDAVVALAGVDLDLGPGTLVAVVGPSGAGKTTLLRALLGEVMPLAGDVDPRPAELRGEDRHGVAYVPQHVGLVRMLTAWENVGVTASLGHRRAADARHAAREALDAVGLDQALDQLPDELSGGEQQRVAVARALARRGAVLLADEPTTELDANNRGRVLDLLRAEADDGAAVLMTTHDPAAAERCDAVVTLHEGRRI